jgi:plastocyanin
MVAGVKLTRGLAVVAVVLAALGVSGCSSSSSSGGRQITIKDFTFRPANLSVKVGDIVTVSNHDTTLHGLIADDRSFNAGSINPGNSQTVTINKAGRFSYHCTFHASMTGVITVKS